MKKYFINKSLILEVITVGFGGIGESIIVLLKNDDKVLISILVDYYERPKTQNVISKILDDNNVTHLDIICWTHPHTDHSRGLFNFLCERSDSNTQFMYPAYLIGLSWETRDLDSKKLIELINSKQKGILKAYNFNGILKPIAGSMELYRCKFDYYSKKTNFSIHALSPSLSEVEKKMVRNDENEINDFSIALKICFGESTIILAGDIQNNSISRVEEHMRPESIEYLKVPHHGSDSSFDILEWIDDGGYIGTSVVTAYSRCKLPYPSSLIKYSNKSKKLYSISKDDKLTNKFAYVKTIFDVLSETCDHQIEGSLITLYEKKQTS